MNRTSLAGLFVCNLVVFSCGNGFLPSVWVGMIMGFSLSGAAFQHLGMRAGLESGAAVALLAVPLFL